jgi:hypothetical protein
MKFTIAKLACKVLTGNAEFCKEIGLFGILAIPENDPVFQMKQKEAFDKWLGAQAINSAEFWEAFEKYLKSDSCKQEHGFMYDPAKAAWEQSW